MRPAVYSDDDLARFCLGDREAMEWLKLWRLYVHAVDDKQDGDMHSKEESIQSYADACELFSHPFYLRNVARLRGAVLMVTNTYADAVKWETATEDWKRQQSDILRHAGSEMVREVMLIVGGYRHLRLFSELLRTICHHDV